MKVIRFSDLCASGDVAGKRVFIRADLNVPQDASGAITEDTLIRASTACIRMALEAGAAVMVTSHLGCPTEGGFKPADSLAPVAERLSALLGCPVPLLTNWVAGVNVQPGQVVLLENCRLNVGENNNSDALARQMAALCDIFVHDAFGAAHLAEASTCGLAEFAKVACAGPLLAAEMDAIANDGIKKDMDHISTDGAASLDVPEAKTLPAFEVLARRAQAVVPAVVASLDVARGVGMMGSEASLRKILATVQGSMAGDLPKIVTALAQDDVATANRLLHAIKGYLPIFASDALVAQVTEVERISKTEPATVVALLYAQLAPRLDALLAEIQSFLAQS